MWGCILCHGRAPRLILINLADGAQHTVERFIIIAQQHDQLADGFFQPGFVLHLQVDGMGLLQMGGQQFSGRQVLVAQNVPEIAKAVARGECQNLLRAAGEDLVQRKRRPGRHQMGYLSVPLITDKQYADLRRNVAVEAVVLDQQVADVVGRHQLAHQAVIINVDVIDQPEDLVAGCGGNAHQTAEGQVFHLVDLAADDAAGGGGSQ